MILTGTIMMHSEKVVETGYLLCDGSAVSRTTYAALFAIISTTYGVGDGSTTFNLPDLTGRAIFGYKSADGTFGTLGNTGGAVTANLQHSHTFNAHTHASASASTAGPSGSLTIGTGSGGNVVTNTHTHSGNATITSCSGQSDQGSNNQLSTTQSIIMRSLTVYPLIAT